MDKAPTDKETSRATTKTDTDTQNVQENETTGKREPKDSPENKNIKEEKTETGQGIRSEKYMPKVGAIKEEPTPTKYDTCTSKTESAIKQKEDTKDIENDRNTSNTMVKIKQDPKDKDDDNYISKEDSETKQELGNHNKTYIDKSESERVAGEIKAESESSVNLNNSFETLNENSTTKQASIVPEESKDKPTGVTETKTVSKDVQVNKTASDEVTGTTQTTSKSRRKKRRPQFNYSVTIYEISKRLHPELAISEEAIRILNAFACSLLDRIARDARHLSVSDKRSFIRSRDIQAAVRCLLTGRLVKPAMSKATKAVRDYLEHTYPWKDFW